MKIMIAGSRSITDFDLSAYVPEDAELIISGGAVGIDSLAEEYADKKRISKLIMRPRYDLYGRAAPLKRNEIMVDISDKVIVIWDGKSKGSVATIKYAQTKKKNLLVVNILEKQGKK